MMKSIILVLVVLAALFLISQSWAPNKSFKMRGIGSTALRRPLFAGKGFGGGSKSPESLMIDKVRDMIAENPSDDSLYFNLGLLFVQQGVPDAALDAFEKSVSLNPGRDGSWYNIGLLYEERVDENSLERTLEAYDKAIEMTEREDISVGSFNNKVAVLLAMQPPMLDQAALVSDAAVKRHPNSPACWCSMGVVIRTADSADSAEWAIKCFQNAAACIDADAENSDPIADPSFIAIHNNLGNLYARSAISDPSKLELYNKAIHHYQLAVQADPRDVSSLLGLAQLLVDVDRRAGPVGTGDPEQSLNNSSNSNNSNNNNNNNNEERVISLLEQICAVEPHHPEASYRLAMIRSQSHLTDISIEIGAAPREYVRGLFDYYANTGTYDEHLVKQLEYRGPELLWASLQRWHKSEGQEQDQMRTLDELSVLDLGCGSGLVASYMRERGLGPLVMGCDLSPAMVQRAQNAVFVRKLKMKEGDGEGVAETVDMVYSRVHEAEAGEFLEMNTVMTENKNNDNDNGNDSDAGVDVAMAGDVLCYIGDLRRLTLQAAAALTRPGCFIFTVEEMPSSSSGAVDNADAAGSVVSDTSEATDATGSVVSDVSENKNMNGSGMEKGNDKGKEKRNDIGKNKGYALLKSGRFHHSEEYLRECAEDAGLCVREVQRVVLRKDGDEEIRGLVCCFTKIKIRASKMKVY